MGLMQKVTQLSKSESGIRFAKNLKISKKPKKQKSFFFYSNTDQTKYPKSTKI
jgi:hypothetical protein